MSTEASRSPYEDRVVHEYDGIEEYDNHLPRWWLATLYGAVVFALVYWFHYQVFQSGASIQQSFEASMAADRRAAAERVRRAGTITDDALLTLARDPSTLAAGRAQFASTCVVCHGAQGGGGIGPNLTDSAWLHGRRPTQIMHTIMEGVPAKGMQAWGTQLGMERVLAVAAYITTLRDTNVPGGKAPQGDVPTD